MPDLPADVDGRIEMLWQRLQQLEADLAEAKRVMREYDQIRVARENFIISLIPLRDP